MKNAQKFLIVWVDNPRKPFRRAFFGRKDRPRKTQKGAGKRMEKNLEPSGRKTLERMTITKLKVKKKNLNAMVNIGPKNPEV